MHHDTLPIHMYQLLQDSLLQDKIIISNPAYQYEAEVVI